MNTHKVKDLGLGYKGELKFYNKYKKKNSSLKWLSKTDKFSTFDFKLGNRYIELKTRRYYKKDFDRGGHIIEGEKLVWLKKNKFSGMIVWSYYDGLYYYDVRNNKLREDITIECGGTYRRGRDERKDLAYVNGDKLILLTKKIYTDREDDVCLID